MPWFLATDPYGHRYRVQISLEDADRVMEHHWNVDYFTSRGKNPRRYVTTYFGSRSILLHRYIMLGITDAEDAREVGLRNGNGLDCRRENLKLRENERMILLYGEDAYYERKEKQKKRLNRIKERSWVRRKGKLPMRRIG